MAASLIIVALPAVLRENSDQDTDSLPLPDQRNLLLLLDCCAVITMTIWAIRRTRSRRTGQP